LHSMNQLGRIQYLHSNPPRRPSRDLILCYIHRHWKVYSQWPECHCAQKSHNIVEERKQHRNQCGGHHKACPPHKPEEIHIESPIERYCQSVFLVDEVTILPLSAGPSFNKCKQWLAVNLQRQRQTIQFVNVCHQSALCRKKLLIINTSTWYSYGF